MHQNASIQRALVQALQASTLNIDSHTEFIPVNEESTHRVYVFAADSRPYVVKQFITEPFTGLNRVGVFKLQQQLYKAGIAPQPIYLDMQAGVWVESYCERTVYIEQHAEKYLTLGQVLAKIHQLKLDLQRSVLPHLDLPQQWQNYLQVLPDSLACQWQADIDQAQDEYRDFFDMQPRVLCHNDLSFSHIFDVNLPLVIDWEYAAISNPFFDIVNALLITNTPRHEFNQVFRGYADVCGKSLQEIENGVQTMKLCAKVTNGLWYAAKSALPL